MQKPNEEMSPGPNPLKRMLYSSLDHSNSVNVSVEIQNLLSFASLQDIMIINYIRHLKNKTHGVMLLWENNEQWVV